MATSTHSKISCTKNISFSTKSSPLNFSRPSQIFLNPSRAAARRRGDVKIRCAASSEGRENPDSLSEAKLDRRNVLLGLGGLYGAYNLAGGSNPFALADPIPAPDISKCGTAIISNSTDEVPYSCCPPFDGTFVDYKIPTFSTLNCRPAAHAVDEDYLNKYKTAIQKMKELPADDPRNFYQQANVHCAYCNGAYQLNDKSYQIHFTWLFFPFHRWYLYFYERILQSLIDDPTFTLPYWNWDNPQGMILPEIFDDDESSPLYDQYRNQDHRNGYVLDLAYAGEENTANDFQKVKNNLAVMYRQMLTNAPCPLLFFGKPLRADNDSENSGMGTIENVPHNSIHRWVGDPRTAHNEDMGNFYSAAKDPVFYCHHSNVDRMWTLWKTLGGDRKDIPDTDWLQTEFLFYDETKTLVKVKVADCLDNERLGYTFQRVAGNLGQDYNVLRDEVVDIDTRGEGGAAGSGPRVGRHAVHTVRCVPERGRGGEYEGAGQDRALLDVYVEMEKELVVKGESYRINYAKNELAPVISRLMDDMAEHEVTIIYIHFPPLLHRLRYISSPFTNTRATSTCNTRASSSPSSVPFRRHPPPPTHQGSNQMYRAAATYIAAE
nr:catechol oxidase B, chloroplastic-like [Ipomoea trifida]